MLYPEFACSPSFGLGHPNVSATEGLGSRDRRELFYFLVQGMALGDDLVHEAKSPSVLGRHEIIAVERPVDRLVVLAGVADVDLIQAPLHLDDVLGVPLDGARLALIAAGRLMQQDAGVGKRVAHALLAGA